MLQFKNIHKSFGSNKIISNFNLEGCIIYTSCEPCTMCLSACYWARLDKIYYANTREDAANIGFDDEYIYEEIRGIIHSLHF